MNKDIAIVLTLGVEFLIYVAFFGFLFHTTFEQPVLGIISGFFVWVLRLFFILKQIP